MPFTLKHFTASLGGKRPPADASASIQALWWDAKGDWDKAHGCVDSAEDSEGMRVHAYLHRKHGDLDNAGYWYRRTGRAAPSVSPDQERDALMGELLQSA